MPELPEVETTVAGLRQVLQDQQMTAVEPRRADLRWPMPVDLRQRLTGARVTGLRRRAKYGLIDTDRGDTMIFHLGMSGRWRIDPADIGTHDHLLIDVGNGHRLALNDPRRFGSVDLMTTPLWQDFAPFTRMGPEPLGSDFDGAHLKAVFGGRKTPVKAALLDQANVAGLGNIYVCEALHIAGIAPRTMAGVVSRPRLDRLADAVKHVLTQAIEAGGSTLRDYARPDGELGYFSKQWRVYGREGQACPTCGGAVRRRVDSGRSTFDCPKCQR